MTDTKPLESAVQRRRTFAIIAHPDAGKTTLTEKLLLYGGAIQLAGTVKAKRGKKFATSDWLEIEKQRGISVTSSVLSFSYRDVEINLIDTPGHQDFSEDTYRTLTAVDCALMLIDAKNGVEAQTIKLFEVCRLRGLPVIAVINKMDREGQSPFDLMDNIEKVLGIATAPITWPIGQGSDFRGVYDRTRRELLLFDPDALDRSRPVPLRELTLDSPEICEILGASRAETLREDLAMLDGASEPFDRDRFLRGLQAPMFFASALNNFGIESLLEALRSLAPSPQPRPTATRTIDPLEAPFTGFVFKIQANMDPQHRDRVAFLRICSGHFERGMKAFHVRSAKTLRLGRPTQFMAHDRSLVDEAYAGDIIGIHDPGVFRIGDTLTEGESLSFSGIPVFAPEHFARVVLRDPLKAKQLNKALDQLSEEGAVQVFRPTPESPEKIVGVVGALQFDVVKFRVDAEYGVHADFAPMNLSTARWLEGRDPLALQTLLEKERSQVYYDHRRAPVLLLDHDWRVKVFTERYPGVVFHSTSAASGGEVT